MKRFYYFVSRQEDYGTVLGNFYSNIEYKENDIVSPFGDGKEWKVEDVTKIPSLDERAEKARECIDKLRLILGECLAYDIKINTKDNSWPCCAEYDEDQNGNPIINIW